MPNKQIIIMSKKIASNWLKSKTKPRYEITIFNRDKSSKRTAELLRSVRDNKIKLAGMDTISDLGIKESFDGVTLWSSNHAALEKLAKWFEVRGYDTTGVL